MLDEKLLVFVLGAPGYVSTPPVAASGVACAALGVSSSSTAINLPAAASAAASFLLTTGLARAPSVI